MTKGKITKSMLDNLEYDLQSKEISTKMEIVPAGQPLTTPTAMFVFAGGDLNAAAYHLIKSLDAPFLAGAIASVFVEESVLERFITTFRPQLPKYDTAITQHDSYKHALESASRLNAKIIEEASNNSSGAFVVCDFTHEHLSPNGASGVVTLHTFRTAKEAIALLGKETLRFESVTIWNENHSCAYELIAALRSSNFFINCNHVSLEPLKSHATAGESYVTMNKTHHYETFSCDGVRKNIVFPVGTIFAN